MRVSSCSSLLKNNVFRYNGEESDFLETHLHKNVRFLLSFKKKKKSHSVFNKEAIDSSDDTTKEPAKAWRLLMLLLLIVLG